MLLCKESIIERNLVTNYNERNFRLGSYDLSIDKLVTAEAKVVEEYILPPQGMVKVISTELVALPSNVIGYVFVKTNLCNEGVLALNIGIVDPGFSGPLQSVLINFGKNPISLNKSDVFSRISFHSLDAAQGNTVSEKAVTHEKLIANVKRQATVYMGSTFMDVEGTASKAAAAAFEKYKSSMYTAIPILALLMTGLTFALNFGNMWLLQSYSKPQDQVRTELLSAELKERLDILELENNKLRNALNIHAEERVDESEAMIR
jgi:dUTPase